MNELPSTIPNSIDHTIGQLRRGELDSVAKTLILEWQQTNDADLVAAVRGNPEFLTQKSILLTLALEEYKIRRSNSESFDVDVHCQRFASFDTAIRYSIVRQLEVQSFLDRHPDLLELLSEPDWPACGDSLGPFDFLDELGRGSLARVYLCQQRDIGDRQVVLKVSPIWQFEASILGRLEHPNIVPIYSVGSFEDRGIHYLCMPFLGRSTLLDLVTCAFGGGGKPTATHVRASSELWNNSSDELGASPWLARATQLGRGTYVGAILRIAIQLADALAHAHAREIVHGDLKPSNVVLTPTGDALLLDFNLSRDLVRSIGLPGGTVPYMAPEQLRTLAENDDGELGNFESDVRSDIYAFGALLYELLMGSVPFSASASVGDYGRVAKELLEQARNEPVKSLRKRNPMISHRIDEIVVRCLAYDPDQRPQLISEVAEELRKETRLAPAVRRRISANPRRYAVTFCGLSTILIVTAMTAALRPEPYVTAYKNGLDCAKHGDMPAAIAAFEKALARNPVYDPARFELARAKVQTGNIRDAIANFKAIVYDESSTSKVESTAYLGYCFNAQTQDAAAIPWYKKALEASPSSQQLICAVRNNIGASYLSARGRLREDNLVGIVSEHLAIAKRLQPDNSIVELNSLRLELLKSTLDQSQHPTSLAARIEAVCESLPTNSRAWKTAARVYGRLHPLDPKFGDMGLHALSMAVKLGGIDSEEFLLSDPDIASLRTQAGFTKILSAFRNQPIKQPNLLARSAELYLEPVDR